MDAKALIEPSWKKMDVDTIFLRDNHRPGGVIVLEWSGDIKKEVPRLGFNIETGLQVEYLDSPAPLRDGYYRLAAIKIMAGGSGSSVADFLKQFAMNEWRRLGINFENIDERPNKNDCKVGFLVGEKNGLLLVASTWINLD